MAAETTRQDARQEGAAVAEKEPFDASALTPYLFLAPAVLVMFAGLVFPVFDAFYLAFFDWEIGAEIRDGAVRRARELRPA